MFEMPKKTEKGERVTGTNIRGPDKRRSRMRKGGNHATTTDSSETETPQGSNACRDASSWVRMVINWIGNDTNCYLAMMNRATKLPPHNCSAQLPRTRAACNKTLCR